MKANELCYCWHSFLIFCQRTTVATTRNKPQVLIPSRPQGKIIYVSAASKKVQELMTELQLFNKDGPQDGSEDRLWQEVCRNTAWTCMGAVRKIKEELE